MEFAPGVLHLAAGGADGVGLAEEDLEVDFVGEPLTIALNPTYLTDGLGSLRDRVTFGFTTASKPAVLRPASDESRVRAPVVLSPPSTPITSTC